MVVDVSDLRAFCLVADLRSLTAAAKALGESKATVSRRISRLEQSLDVTLLKRSPRLVEPTEDGVAYRMRVGHVLELLGDANAAVRRKRSAPSGLLRVTSPPEFNAMLAPVVVAFAERYPAVRLEMVVTQSLLDLDVEHIDVALRVAFRLPDSPLIAHKLLELDAAIVASPEYLRRFHPPKKPEDLAKHRYVALAAARELSIPLQHVETGAVTNMRLDPYMTSSEMSFVTQLAIAGGGLAILPSAAVEHEVADGRLVRLMKGFVVSGAALHILHHGGRFLSPKVRAFRDFVIDALRPRPVTR